MGAGVKPELQNEEDPLTAYRQQRDAVDPLTAYRQSKSGGSIVLPPGDTTADVAEPPKPMRLRPVVVTKREELPKPPAAAASDATRVGPEPVGLAGHLQSHAPGQSGNFANDVAESAMEMVTHPVETAKALGETPFKGGQALGEYVAGRGSKKAAIAGTAQTAAMLLGGPAEKLAEPAVARLVGEAAAPAVTRTALGAATGAVFTPDRPGIGATLGGLAGALSSKGAAAQKRALKMERFAELAKQHPDWFGESTPAEAETRRSRTLANPNAPKATATVAEPESAATEPDFTVEEPTPPIIRQKGVFGGALEQHGKDYAEGKVAPPTTNQLPATPNLGVEAPHPLEELEANPPVRDPKRELRWDKTYIPQLGDRVSGEHNDEEQTGVVVAGKDGVLKVKTDKGSTVRLIDRYGASKWYVQGDEQLAHNAAVDQAEKAKEAAEKAEALRAYNEHMDALPKADVTTLKKGDVLHDVSGEDGEPGILIFDHADSKGNIFAHEPLGRQDAGFLGDARGIVATGENVNDPAVHRRILEQHHKQLMAAGEASEEDLPQVKDDTEAPSPAEDPLADYRAGKGDPELSNMTQKELAGWAGEHIEGQRNEAKRAAAKERLARSGFYDKYLDMGPEKLLDLSHTHYKISQASAHSASAVKKITSKLEPSEYLHSYGDHELIRNAPEWFYKAIHAGSAYGSMLHAEKEMKRVAKEGVSEHKPGWSKQYYEDRKRDFEQKRDEVVRLMDEARNRTSVAAEKAEPEPTAGETKKRLGAKKRAGAETKEPVHETPRLPSGRLRDKLETVKTDGLIREMFQLLGAEDQRDARRAIYRTVEADVSGTQFGVMIQAATRHGKGPSEQAKALHRIELKKGAAKRIEAVLNARGLTDEEITRRYAELTETAADLAAEREGLDNDKGDTSFDFGDKEGNNESDVRVAERTAAEGANAPAERASERGAGAAGQGEEGRPPKSQAEPSEVARKRAELYHQLHMASTPSARFNVLEQIKALDRPKPEIKGAITPDEMAERARAGETREAVKDITGEEPTPLSRDKKQSEMFGSEVETPPAPKEQDDLFSMLRSEADDDELNEAALRDAERRMRDALHKTKNGYEQSIHDLWQEAGHNGRLQLLEKWRRLYKDEQWRPEWANREVADLPEHVREKIGIERVNQVVALYKLINGRGDDIASKLRTGDNSVGAQFDKSLFKKLGANLYKGDIPSVIVKEAIQNAFDSVRPLGEKGRIHVAINPGERTISVSDNGHGMTPDVASNEFMDVGGSSKLEGSSGGFGLAKVGLLASAEHFSMVTIAKVQEKGGFLGRAREKRIITTIEGSADDWINGTLKFDSHELKDDTEGTGTRLTVKVSKDIEPTFYNAEALFQNILDAHHEPYQLTGTVSRKSYSPNPDVAPGGESKRPITARNRAELNREATIRESVPGADLDAIPSKEVIQSEGPFGSATEVFILNNGLYQFGSIKTLGVGAPKQIVINIKPTVGVDHPDYPFTTSREDLKGKVVEALGKIYRDIASAAGANEIRDLIRALKAGIPIGRDATVRLYDTTYATPRELLDAFSKKPYVHEMADRFGDMMTLIAKVIDSRLPFPKFEFGGLSTAGGYLGVNISRAVIAEKARALNIGFEGEKTNIILINPWQIFDEHSLLAGTPRMPKQLFTDDDYAPVLAEASYATIVHEIAHQTARGHGEEFAGVQTRFDGVAVRVAPVVLQALEDMWRVALQGGLRDDVNNLRTEAWGRGKPDIFKKYAGHLRAGSSEGDTGGLSVGGDAAAAHLRPSEADGGVGEGDAERRGLGARARGSVRGSAARSETAGDAGSRTPGPVPRNGRKPESAVDGSEPDTTAVATAAAGRFDKAVDDVKKMFAPASRGPLARETANITREQVARMAHENEIARDRLAGFAKAFDKMSREYRLEFIDAMENPRPQATEQLSDAADAIRDMLDSARDAVRRLGTGHLENFIENYFPHIWSNPDEAARVINQITGKRPLEGTRSFLKRRTIPTIKEGMELGLEPISTNPVDLSLLKIREMNRYIMGQRVLGEMKRAQLAKFVNAFEKAPDGYARINDHVAMVYGPPTVPVGEAFDALVRKQLVDVIKSLGVEHTRPIKIKGLRSAGGGTVWGVAEGDRRIQAKFGGDATIIMHELGHILDHRYGLWHKLVERVAKRPNTKAKLEKNRGKLVPDQKHPSNSEGAKKRRVTIKKELRALADLRYEGENPDNVASTYKDYVRERPEQVANAVHAYIYAKAKMQRVAPTVYDVLDGIIKGDPKLAPLANVEPSVKLGSGSNETPVGGLVVKGQYWAPEAAASIINNYLSPGLRGNAVFDSYMGLGNFMNGAQLGFSAFHLGFTSMEAAVSRVALSLRQLAAGKPSKALRSFATAPAAPITNYMRGRQLYNAYLHPDRSNAEMTQIVDALVSGGGRIRMDNFYKSGAIEGLKKALEEHNPWGVAWRAYPAFIELAVKPILEHIVPRQKMGVFSDLARLEIEKLGQNPDPKDVRASMAKIWDSVDNRMGQLVYDNLFWNKVGKDLAMASVRAVGWNLGTLREIGGGLAEIPSSYKRWKEGDEILTTKLSYIVALPIFVGMMGAIYNYLATGEAPKELKDYFYPRTGALGPDGNPERVQLPSYMKDVWAYAHHPVNTIESKLHPTIEQLSEMLHNKDFYGTMIVDPDAPLDEKVKEYGKFLARSIQPFALRNALVARERGQSLATQAQSFVGVTAAPREVVRTPAQNKMAEFLSRHAPGSRTPEESDKGELHRTVTDAVRKGEQLPESVNAALESEKLKRGTLMTWIHDARLPSTVQQFKKLTLDEAELVYGLATDDEKVLWANAYRTKVVNGQR